MKEIWIDIKDYEGYYKVSNFGRIYSYPRETTKGGYHYGNDAGNGYLKFTLSKNGKQESKNVNRLVWEAFNGPIPEGYDIHHINHNKKDNRLENLELIEMNEHRKKHIVDSVKSNSKPVLQYTLEGELITEYSGVREASRQTGIHFSNIADCCKGRCGYKTAGGSIWRYKNNLN